MLGNLVGVDYDAGHGDVGEDQQGRDEEETHVLRVCRALSERSNVEEETHVLRREWEGGHDRMLRSPSPLKDLSVQSVCSPSNGAMAACCAKQCTSDEEETSCCDTRRPDQPGRSQESGRRCSTATDCTPRSSSGDGHVIAVWYADSERGSHSR
jgi:hypothetical protein